MEIRYSRKSIKQLKKIIAGDKKNGAMLIKKIEEYAENPAENTNIKILKGKYMSFKRLRIGDFRVIFEDDSNIISIFEIKHRKEAYND